MVISPRSPFSVLYCSSFFPLPLQDSNAATRKTAVVRRTMRNPFALRLFAPFVEAREVDSPLFGCYASGPDGPLLKRSDAATTTNAEPLSRLPRFVGDVFRPQR